VTDFVEFEKIARLSREIVITEKIDGTNAQVFVEEINDGDRGYLRVRAGSRNRYITPEADNYGFAAWVRDHEDELKALGPGRHFGEWWGAGIQRCYGLSEKRFSLFNVGRWSEKEQPPTCCHVVPVLYRGMFSENIIHACLTDLREHGSKAAPGFANPEGIIIFHTAARTLFKKTLDRDEEPKSLRGAA
jgi:hypothetical protein